MLPLQPEKARQNRILPGLSFLPFVALIGQMVAFYNGISGNKSSPANGEVSASEAGHSLVYCNAKSEVGKTLTQNLTQNRKNPGGAERM